MKKIVLPGEEIKDKISFGNVYTENGKTYASVLGLYDDENKRIVPLEGLWVPKIDDTVVGIIEEVGRNNSYSVDLASFRIGTLLMGKYSKSSFKVGEVIEAVVDRINGKKEVILSRPRVLYGGTIIKVKPTKIPRVLGKGNTMARQIADLTKCDLVVGSNGIIWIKGEHPERAIEAILKIEEEAHTSGLTERIKEMLVSNSKNKE